MATDDFEGHRDAYCAEPGSDPLASLLTAIGNGDRDAFDELYRNTRGKLFAVALRFAPSPDIAEDILQESFLLIWQKARLFSEASGSPIGWMSTVVRNKAIDHLRAGKRRTQPANLTDAEMQKFHLTSWGKSEAEIVDEQTALCGLRKLPGTYRSSILLAYGAGMTHRELASATDTPLGTIKTRLRRGLDHLRASVEGARPLT